ncbi:hypothetical protein DOTSEDRAFT_33877 [Dothistroma septosporum NZE10]|uniref:Uncharacterized protein n=1 Tax=Dothistroma septosporum (strain NZE10 / CBS 128990) TaxID=675120 RepID=N1PPP7_DOTSN|nr:hypothetical protein DOTSEDRAFT_33877 [Dothistroma septosporum NZE10]
MPQMGTMNSRFTIHDSRSTIHRDWKGFPSTTVLSECRCAYASGVATVHIGAGSFTAAASCALRRTNDSAAREALLGGLRRTAFPLDLPFCRDPGFYTGRVPPSSTMLDGQSMPGVYTTHTESTSYIGMTVVLKPHSYVGMVSVAIGLLPRDLDARRR